MTEIVFRYSDPPTEADQRALTEAILGLSKLVNETWGASKPSDGQGFLVCYTAFEDLHMSGCDTTPEYWDIDHETSRDCFLVVLYCEWETDNGCSHEVEHVGFFSLGRAGELFGAPLCLTWAAGIYRILNYAHHCAALEHSKGAISTLLEQLKSLTS